MLKLKPMNFFFFDISKDPNSQFDIEDVTNFCCVQPVQPGGVTPQLVASTCAESWGLPLSLPWSVFAQHDTHAEESEILNSKWDTPWQMDRDTAEGNFNT